MARAYTAASASPFPTRATRQAALQFDKENTTPQRSARVQARRAEQCSSSSRHITARIPLRAQQHASRPAHPSKPTPTAHCRALPCPALPAHCLPTAHAHASPVLRYAVAPARHAGKAIFPPAMSDVRAGQHTGTFALVPSACVLLRSSRRVLVRPPARAPTRPVRRARSALLLRLAKSASCGVAARTASRASVQVTLGHLHARDAAVCRRVSRPGTPSHASFEREIRVRCAALPNARSSYRHDPKAYCKLRGCMREPSRLRRLPIRTGAMKSTGREEGMPALRTWRLAPGVELLGELPFVREGITERLHSLTVQAVRSFVNGRVYMSTI